MLDKDQDDQPQAAAATTEQAQPERAVEAASVSASATGSDRAPQVKVPDSGEPARPDDAEADHDEDSDNSVPTLGNGPLVGDGPCRIAVASTPAGAMIHLDGTELAPSPATIATTCGKHKIDFKHRRYKQLTKLVATTEAAPATVEVTLQRPTHNVTFTSQPAGATVFIDGRRAGTTPTSVSILGFSNLKVEIKKTGYAPVSTRLYSKVPQDSFATRLRKW
jgi:hypothetical protein